MKSSVVATQTLLDQVFVFHAQMIARFGAAMPTTVAKEAALGRTQVVKDCGDFALGCRQWLGRTDRDGQQPEGSDRQLTGFILLRRRRATRA